MVKPPNPWGLGWGVAGVVQELTEAPEVQIENNLIWVVVTC